MRKHSTARLLLFLLLMFGVVLSAHAADGDFTNDPNGFKGYSWGTSLAQFDGLVVWGKSEGASGSTTYHFPDESLVLGDVEVDKVLYVFAGDTFKRVTVRYHNGDNYDALLSALTARFGTGRNESRFSHDVSWVGPQTHMILRYDDQYDEGVLVVSQLDYRTR